MLYQRYFIYTAWFVVFVVEKSLTSFVYINDFIQTEIQILVHRIKKHITETRLKIKLVRIDQNLLGHCPHRFVFHYNTIHKYNYTSHDYYKNETSDLFG